MKKLIKKIVLVIISLIFIWSLYVLIDCVRLGNNQTSKYPLITIDYKEDVNKKTYIGLGYSISYYVTEEHCYGAEFRLFSKILVWVWIE